MLPFLAAHYAWPLFRCESPVRRHAVPLVYSKSSPFLVAFSAEVKCGWPRALGYRRLGPLGCKTVRRLCVLESTRCMGLAEALPRGTLTAPACTAAARWGAMFQKFRYWLFVYVATES